MSIVVVPHERVGDAEWDSFVAGSRNGTFMHMRPYVDYHAERFLDSSMVARSSTGQLVAVLPANVVRGTDGTQLVSHAGLTYGGWVLAPRTTLAEVLEAFDRLDEHCRQQGIGSVVYKAVPRAYHLVPSDEDEYALHLRGARKVRHDVSAVVTLDRRVRLSSGRRDGVRRARRAGLVVEERQELDDFHGLLTQVLDQRHGAAPTHSAEELELLRSRFPESIRLFVALEAGQVVAGALVYDCGQTVHTQYLASGARGRETGALDLVVLHLIEDVYASRRYLSFGISTEDGGRTLNGGLMTQKEMFGARAMTCATWAWRP